MSNFTLIVPESGINLVSNPSLEIDATGYTAWGGGSVARTTTRAARGRYSLGITPTATTTDGAYYTLTLTALTQYTFSVDVRGTGSVPFQIDAYDVTAGASFGTPTEWTGANTWLRKSYTFTTGANTNIRLRINKDGHASTTVFYADGWQCEAKDHATTYIDGEQPGCRWRNSPHASTSTRDSNYRGGGREYDLTALGVTGVLKWGGIGTPPYSHQVIDQPATGKYRYAGSRPKMRPILLELWDSGTSVANLHALREELVRAVVPERVSRHQEWLLRTDVAGTQVEIPVIYEGGLEHKLEAGFQETIALRLLALDPYWRELFDSSAALDATDGSVPLYAMGRVGMHWDVLGPPSAVTAGIAGPAVYAIVEGPDGWIYFGGDFTNWNGIAAADYLVKWDPVSDTWSAVSTGGTGAVRALAFDALGNLYIGGEFTNWNAIAAADNIVMWTGSAYAAVGNGFNARVNDLAIGADGTVWATGTFTTDATTGVPTLTRIAYWDGSTWTMPGTGLNSTGVALARGPDGSMYVAGDFTLAGGVAGTVRIAQWTGAAFAPLGSGIADNGVDALTFGPGGILYVAGSFTTAGGLAAPGIARWTGGWAALGSGVAGGTARVFTVAATSNGNVYIGGNFTSAGGLDLCDALARWDGAAFVHIGVNLPGSAQVFAIAATTYDDLYLGFDTGAGSYRGDGAVEFTYTGSAPAYPRIVLIRSGGTGTFTLQHIYNQTTGHELFFDLDMIDGEKLVIDLEAKTITSNFKGNCLPYLRGASTFASFCLQPSDNTVGVFVDGASAASVITAYAFWRNSHVSVDTVA